MCVVLFLPLLVQSSEVNEVIGNLVRQLEGVPEMEQDAFLESHRWLYEDLMNSNAEEVRQLIDSELARDLSQSDAQGRQLWGWAKKAWQKLKDHFDNSKCAPDNFTENYVSQYPAAFSAAKWQQNRWFVMAQQKVAYQNDEARFNCITARYCPYNGSGIPNKFRKFGEFQISVYNTGCTRNGDGTVDLTNCNDPENVDSSFQNLGAMVSDEAKGKLNVLPTILPSILKSTGPYWIMAFGCETDAQIEAGETAECGAESEYTWGVVVGGSPSKEYEAAAGSEAVCSTQVSGYIGGLWVFSTQKRTNFDGSNLQTFIYNKIQGLGVTTSQLINVNQESCPDFNDPCPNDSPANLLV